MKINPCLKCGRRDTGEKWAHDPCIANMPGVINACCGHGNQGEAYFMFSFGPTIRGSHRRAELLIRAGAVHRNGCSGLTTEALS